MTTNCANTTAVQPDGRAGTRPLRWGWVCGRNPSEGELPGSGAGWEAGRGLQLCAAPRKLRNRQVTVQLTSSVNCNQLEHSG